MSSKLALICAVFLTAAAWADPELNAERAFLNTLPEKHEITVSDFDYPFLISQTAVLSSVAAQEMVARIEKHLRKNLVDVGSHGKDGKAAVPLKIDLIQLPKESSAGDQLEAIQTCRSEKCQMKLNDAEKALVEKSAKKVDEYQRLIRERVKAYLTENKLAGYEDRASDEPYVKKMVGSWPFFSAKYPEIAHYFADGFWKKAAPPKPFQSAYVTQALIPFGLSRLQPIYRVGEVFSFDQAPARVFVEMHVYSNHYFDSSLRLWEILPAGAKTQVIVTDILEIDELTKSSFVRFLYRAEMEGAIKRYQHEELGGIPGLST